MEVAKSTQYSSLKFNADLVEGLRTHWSLFPAQSRPKCVQMQQWCFETYGITISDLTLRRMLRDLTHPPGVVTSRSSMRLLPRWPVVEALLAAWIGDTGGMSGFTEDSIRTKAKEIYGKIPVYEDTPVPQFCSDWIRNFRNRGEIRVRPKLEKTGQTPETVIRGSAELQKVCQGYAPSDIFSMGETVVLMHSDPSASADSDNKCITCILCCNADGSEKVPAYFVGKGRKRYPKALASLNLEAQPCRWHSNKYAWATGVAIADWLETFYHKVDSREVLLLLDNSTAHISGLNQRPPPSNIKVVFFPFNPSNGSRPLEHLCQLTKASYRKLLHLSSKDPPRKSKEVGYREAVLTLVQAWENVLTPQAIEHIFKQCAIPLVVENENDYKESQAERAPVNEEMGGQHQEEKSTVKEEAGEQKIAMENSDNSLSNVVKSEKNPDLENKPVRSEDNFDLWFDAIEIEDCLFEMGIADELGFPVTATEMLEPLEERSIFNRWSLLSKTADEMLEDSLLEIYKLYTGEYPDDESAPPEPPALSWEEAQDMFEKLERYTLNLEHTTARFNADMKKVRDNHLHFKLSSDPKIKKWST